MDTFLFLYDSLRIGGIEKNIIDLIRAYSYRKIRIIWMHYGKKDDIYEPWKKFLKDARVEIVPTKIDSKNWFKYKNISFQDNEKVSAVCFNPMDYARLESFAHNYPNPISIYYIVPHFERNINYVEEFYMRNSSAKKTVSNLKPIYRNWYKNGGLLFFNQRHVEEMKKRYDIPTEQWEDKVFVTPLELPGFDYKLAGERAKREEFRIITCGRFDFPHKGYMLGLIDSYNRLKIKYPQLKLDIVGYGPGEDRIKERIESLEITAQKDIVMHGAVAPDNMKILFDKSHVNISVAGGVIDGAKTGLVSIPARHYVYECEVYGWLDGSIENIVSDKAGERVEPYIEQLIVMPKEEYISVCEKSYLACKNMKSDPYWLEKQINKKLNYYNEEEVAFFKNISQYMWKKDRVRQVLNGTAGKLLKKIGFYDNVTGLWKKIRTAQRRKFKG